MDSLVRYNVFAISRRRLIALVSSITLFGFGIWFLNNVLPYKNVWSSYDTSRHISTLFCERTIMENIVRQPFNTFSNFIYWITGLAILRRGWKDQSERKNYNIISANPAYSILYGGILIYTFIASTFFHSSLIRFASHIDFSAVYSLSLFPLMYFTHRVWLIMVGHVSNEEHPVGTKVLTGFFTLIYLFLTLAVGNSTAHYVVLFIILLSIVFAMIVERRDRGKTNYYYLMVAIFTILSAVIFFILDNKKVFCNPESIIQPHSIWHLLSGISSFYFYMYIRSERNRL